MFWPKKWRKKEAQSAREKRKEPRFDELNEITIEPRQSEVLGVERGIYYAQTKNASPGGMKIQTLMKFPLETVLTIKLQSRKTGKLIQATGKVKWVKSIGEDGGFEIGLEFQDTPVNTIMDLLDHIYKS